MLAGELLRFKTDFPNVTALPILEEELVLRAHTSKEVVNLSNTMAELAFGKCFESVTLIGDNNGALHTAGNNTYSVRTKHIYLRFFYSKELVNDGKITIHHVATQKQLADVRT